MKKNYNYNYDSDYSTITTIEEGKRRAFVNALCVTPDIKEAAVALGVAEKTIKDFCGRENIDEEHMGIMRIRFLKSENKHIFIYANGTKKKINC